MSIEINLDFLINKKNVKKYVKENPWPDDPDYSLKDFLNDMDGDRSYIIPTKNRKTAEYIAELISKLICRDMKLKKNKKRRILVDVSDVDWKLLRKQKLYLSGLDTENVIGIVNFLDTIQDQATKIIGEKEVFGK